MIIKFVDIDKNVVNALSEEFDGCDNIEIYHDTIFNHKANAIVSPANSFGYMTGGIDYIYIKFFGQQLQDRLQEQIRYNFVGELLVGQSWMIATGNQDIPWLICSPTMRVPANIGTTANVYLSFKSTLKIAKGQWPPVNSILCPGLGTLSGGMHPKLAAYQMKRAYDEIILNKFPIYRSLEGAREDDLTLRGYATAENYQK